MKFGSCSAWSIFLRLWPYVDRAHIGYYGLSYGGYSALWMGPLDTRLKTVIISGHFNDWTSKISSDATRTSYLLHPDEDFFNWDVLHRFTHPELIAAMFPRAVMVEYADRDATTTPEWHQQAWNQLQQIARAWKAEDRFQRDVFSGVHEIGGMRTFDFEARWLRPQTSPSRTYTYLLWPTSRDLPGIGDGDEDTVPYVKGVLGSTELPTLTDTFSVGTGETVFRGLRLRISRVDRHLRSSSATDPDQEARNSARLEYSPVTSTRCSISGTTQRSAGHSGCEQDLPSDRRR